MRRAVILGFLIAFGLAGVCGCSGGSGGSETTTGKTIHQGRIPRNTTAP